MEQTFKILAQLLLALHYLHERGILHRDVKPANVIITKTGDAVLLDFGIAALNGGQTYAGSHGYSAPEINLARDMNGFKYNSKVDIYSLGILFREMVIGINLIEEDVRRLMNDQPQHVQDLYSLLTQEDPAKRPFAFELLATEQLQDYLLTQRDNIP